MASEVTLKILTTIGHVDPLSGVGQCVKIIERKKEGEECISMSECESVTCIEGKCTHVLDGAVCNENGNCALNSFCMNQGEGNYSICAPLRQKGEECVNDDYCAFNMACGTLHKDSTTRHCEVMFSLDAGAVNDNNLLCKSGLASMIPDGSTYYCADYKMEKSTCTLEQNCTMTIKATDLLSKKYEDTCRCKWDGTSLCRLDSSSTQWTNFVDTYNKEVKELKDEDIKKIHVVLERGNWWGIKNIRNAYEEYGQYLEIDGTPDCVKSFYLTGGSSETSVKLSFLGLVSLIYLLL